MKPWRAYVCFWGRWVVTISLHTLDSWITEQHFLQLDRSCLERCSCNLSKSKPQSDTSGYCCCLERPYKKVPNCSCFTPTLLCPEPAVSLMPVESRHSECRMMLFGFGRLRHLGCSPSLLKELHKASNLEKKKKKASKLSSWSAPSISFPLRQKRKHFLKGLSACPQYLITRNLVINHQKLITHFSNCSNQAGNRLQPKTQKFLPLA